MDAFSQHGVAVNGVLVERLEERCVVWRVWEGVGEMGGVRCRTLFYSFVKKSISG